MNKIRTVLFLSLGLALVGCTGMSSTVDGKTHVFSQQQKCPALLEMDVNHTLELTLNENPSTGFGWSLEKPTKLFTVEETYLSDKNTASESTIVGKGGSKVFKFTAIKPGEELIAVKHARPWENGVSIEEWKCRIRVS